MKDFRFYAVMPDDRKSKSADAFSTDASKRAEWLSCNYTRGIVVCQ